MPLSPVTVICLCYNQERFVKEAIDSVMRQTYANIQLIVVDDCSTDLSATVIREKKLEYPQIQFLALDSNLGNCRAFNRALRLARGEYIIDLAADDVLLPERVEKGVTALTRAGDRFGVNFTDAEWISADNVFLYRHSDRFPHATIPQGDIYKDLIERFFICSPTMMFRRKVIASLGGYDESLTYEDFDFWIRSSRNFKYSYTPEALIKKRVVRNSMSEKQFSIFSPQLVSTYKVCEKILALNKSPEEQNALGKRILYEIRTCLRLLDFSLAVKYLRLYGRNRHLRY
jgi:glycosyltransferase involved in cell wall biosynthesis